MCFGKLGTVLDSILNFRTIEQNPVHLLLLLQATGWVLQRQLALTVLWGEVLGTVFLGFHTGSEREFCVSLTRLWYPIFGHISFWMFL